jgi:hypothetical protein
VAQSPLDRYDQLPEFTVTVAASDDLEPTSLSHAQTLESPAVAQAHNLTPVSLTHAQSSDSSVVTLSYELAAVSSSHAQTLAAAEVFPATDDLLVDGITHAQSIATVELGDVLKPFSEVSNDGWVQYGVADSRIAALRQRSMDAGIQVVPPRGALRVELLSPDGQTVLATWTHNSISSEATQYDRDVSSMALTGAHRIRVTAFGS